MDLSAPGQASCLNFPIKMSKIKYAATNVQQAFMIL